MTGAARERLAESIRDVRRQLRRVINVVEPQVAERCQDWREIIVGRESFRSRPRGWHETSVARFRAAEVLRQTANYFRCPLRNPRYSRSRKSTGFTSEECRCPNSVLFAGSAA